jgi:hypothetical protein
MWFSYSRITSDNGVDKYTILRVLLVCKTEIGGHARSVGIADVRLSDSLESI